jgi:hypothetical protein
MQEEGADVALPVEQLRGAISDNSEESGDDHLIARSPGYRDITPIEEREAYSQGDWEEGEDEEPSTWEELELRAGAADGATHDPEANFAICEPVTPADILVPGFLRQAPECAICMDEFRMDDNLPLLQMPGCDHVFHSQCLRKWIDRNSTCPLCRTSIGENAVNRRRTI